MCLAGQWDTVNGEVLRRPTGQTLMDCYLERHSITDIKPVELQPL